MSQIASFAADKLGVPTLVKHPLARLLAFFALAGLPVLFGRGAVKAAANLYPLADSAQPYFAPAYAGLLYVWSPLVVISAGCLLLTPGLLLALALNSAKNAGQWVLSGFALSLIIVSAAAGAVQFVINTPLRDGAFVAVVLGCSVLCLALLLARLARGQAVAWPFQQPYAGITLASMMLVPLLLVIALTPKFYWDNFNGDGAHAYESARLLLVQPLPFWPPTAGTIADFPGITSVLFAFPASWFIRLFGEYEVSARLPLLLYVVALYSALLALIEHGRSKPAGQAERWLLWLNLIVYVVVMAFSATYNPYSADIALPATQDTLLMVCYFGFILGFLRQDHKWMWLFIGLTYISLPNGLLLIGFWLGAVLLVWRPRPWRQIWLTAAAVCGCLVVTVLAPHILALLHLPAPGREYGALELLKRFAFLQWADWRRLVFLIVPSGILPAAALLAWRWQDQVARALTVVTVVCFGFFYVQAHIVLHYFVPVMLLPLAVFWRNSGLLNTRFRPWLLACAGAAAAVALVLSLPQDARPHTTARLIGAAAEDRVGEYNRVAPATFRRAELFNRLFPYDWSPDVPLKSYGGSPLVWNYYAHQPKTITQPINYVLQPAEQPAPLGLRLVARDEDTALYLKNDSLWATHLAIRPPTPAGSPIYTIPRGIIFRSVPVDKGPPIINVVQVLEASGFDMSEMLNRAGVKYP